MGNVRSTRRKVQPSLPFSFDYDRLSASSLSPERQALLDKDDDVHHCMDQIKPAFEALCKKNASLENDTKELGKKLANLESKKSSDESAIKGLRKKLDKLQNQNFILEKEGGELRKKVVKLELVSPMDPFMKKQGNAIETIQTKNSELEKRMNNLNIKVDQMESTSINTLMLQTDSAQQLVAEATVQENLDMNDLVGAVVVLIFVVCVLIGINL